MKKSIFIVFVTIMLISLSACGKPKMEFAYDQDITWESSYQDILQKYGTPSEERRIEITDEYIMNYGTDKSYIQFRFNSKGHLQTISIVSQNLTQKRFSEDKTNALNHLVDTYGDKYKNEKGAQFNDDNYTWDNTVDNTTIQFLSGRMTAKDEYGFVISYKLKKDTIKEAYTDIPMN